MIILTMKKLLTITITVIVMFYRQNRMESKKQKNKKQKNKTKQNKTKKKNKTDLAWFKNWSGKHAYKYFFLLTSKTVNGNVRNKYQKKKVKNNGAYNTFQGPLSQEWIDERYWSPGLICYVN